jgi:CDP-diacylglycerol--serine O-phosphatidyltransferase
MLIISFLMVSNVRFPSFKKFDWTARARTRGFVLIIIAGFVIFRYPQFTFPAVFLGYISYSIFRHAFLLKKSEMDPAPEDDDEPVSKV